MLIAYRDETKAPLRVCETHKASLESEQRRIEELGGFVQEVNGTKRLNGILAVTRSFGDARFKRFVTAEPSIKVFDLDGSEDFIVRSSPLPPPPPPPPFSLLPSPFSSAFLSCSSCSFDAIYMESGWNDSIYCLLCLHGLALGMHDRYWIYYVCMYA